MYSFPRLSSCTVLFFLRTWSIFHAINKYGFVDCEVLAYSSNVKSLHTVLNFRIQFRLYFSYCGFIISNYQLLVGLYISIYHTHNYYPSATNREYQQRILCIPHIYKFNFFKNRTMLRSKFATYI